MLTLLHNDTMLHAHVMCEDQGAFNMYIEDDGTIHVSEVVVPSSRVSE